MAIYAALGEKERAIRLLERAFEKRDQFVLALKVEQAFDSLRSDQRFQNLMRRIGLPL